MGQYRHVAQCHRGLRPKPAAAHAALPGDGGLDLPASVKGRCVIRIIGIYACRTGPPWDHSGLAPENLTTLAHFSVSSTMNIPRLASEPRNIVVPRSASRACILSSVRTALISLLRRLMISTGVFLRKPVANHWLAA